MTSHMTFLLHKPQPDKLVLQKRTGTKPDSDLANLGKTSPHHLWGRDSREREREEQGLPKCIRFSPEPPLIDPLLSFRGTRLW